MVNKICEATNNKQRWMPRQACKVLQKKMDGGKEVNAEQERMAKINIKFFKPPTPLWVKLGIL